MCSENRKNHASLAAKSVAAPGYPWTAKLFYSVLAALTIFVIARTLAAQPQAVALAVATSGVGALYQQGDGEATDNGPRLDDLYARRAYAGAPPPIPHLVDEEDLNGEGCLQCHGEGAFVPRMQAYAPITPHPQQTACWQCHVALRPPDADTTTENAHDPESGAPPPTIPHEVELTRNCLGCHSIPRRQAIENCRQCHVATTPEGVSIYDSSNWEPLHTGRKPALLPGAPPAIPHDLQMRNDCLACHAGPAAAVEIRTPHPERFQCQQCHVSVVTDAVWMPEH
ncbi:MAG: hypothetical protein R3C14_14475 [Caldilineaceae bacterium]